MTTDPTKPTVQEADVAALIAHIAESIVSGDVPHYLDRMQRRNLDDDGLAADGHRDMAKDAIIEALQPLASALERAQADTARLDYVLTWLHEHSAMYLEDDLQGPRFIAHRWGGDNVERREGIDAAMSQSSSAT